jgi:Tol biopolymer transport system component
MLKTISCLFALVALLLYTNLTDRLRQSSAAAQPAQPAPKLPRLFAEGSINTTGDEYGPAFTPDGQTVYFVRRVNRSGPEHILVSRFSLGRWSAPEMAEFSGQYFDKEPFIAPDGKRLFFASQRPVSGTEPKKGRDFDLWYVEKTARSWGAAQHLGPAINTPGYENYPAVTTDGTLYFASVRAGGKGQNDLYRARLINGQYAQPENLAELNTPQTDADPYVAPDGSFMIFSSDRPGSYGEGDLYLSYNRDGKWTEPRNLGPDINTKEYEYTPLVSPDKKSFFFSRGWGEVYQIELSALNLRGSKSARPR